MWRIAIVVLVWGLAVPAVAADPIGDARRLYNQGQYDAALRLAEDAAQTPATANSARVILGRVHLERYRQSASASDLSDARAALREVDPRALDPRERVEYAVGLAEALFLEDRFGASAELFESSLDASTALGGAARERVLDWWATALDRLAQSRPAAERGPIYDRVADRMTVELARDPGSTPAGYWLVAAARGSGNLERAWGAALARWVRAPLARDRGAALRGDLERLVTQAIIPERASRLSARERTQALTGMLAEWDAFKASWSR